MVQYIVDEAIIDETWLLIVGNNKTLVTEGDGRTWRTKNLLLYVYKNNWYVICQLKKTGIYYCNIATPYIIEENTIKYIDMIWFTYISDETCKILMVKNIVIIKEDEIF